MSKSTPRRGRYWARRWHRWLGMVFLFPLLWLTVSGLALRYAEELGLDEATVESGWVLRKYGMFPEGEVRVVNAGDHEVAEWGEVLFLDGKMLDEVGELHGAAAYKGGVVVATAEYLLVYDAGGEWEQKLGEESLPGLPVQSIGTWGDDAIAVLVGGQPWAFDADLIEFKRVEAVGMSWSSRPLKGLDDSTRFEKAIAAQAGIPWSRVMLDLHSGNLGGTVGKLIVDLSGLGIILMSLMGFKLVFRKPRGGGTGA